MAVDSRLYKYITSQETYDNKAVIIQEGGHGDWVYVVLEGRVKVKKKTAKGLLTIATLTEGAIFGELILLQMSKGSRTAAIVADGPVTVGLLNMEQLDKELGAVSPLLKKIFSNLSKRLQDTTRQLVDAYIQ
jgi:CRP-like cAMP-binding protein